MQQRPRWPTEAERNEARRRRSPWTQWVEPDYEIVDGVLRPTSGIGADRNYLPMATPAILGDFVRLRIGDEAALIRFARSWGLLGYDRLLQRDASPMASWAGGDPVAWIWAHLSGIQIALRLWGFWRSKDTAALAEFLPRRQASREQWRTLSRLGLLLTDRKFQEAQTLVERYAAKPSDESAEDVNVLVLSADGPRVAVARYNMSVGRLPPWSGAWNLVRVVINPNMRGVHAEISSVAEVLEDTSLVEQGWDSVISVIYRHLFEAIASGQVEECRECGTPFVRTDKRQRFCPPPRESRESQCAMRFHKREQRRRTRKTDVAESP